MEAAEPLLTGAPERAAERLHALTQVSTAAAGAPSVMAVLRGTGEPARTALDADSLSFSVWERDHARVRVLLNVGELGPGEQPEPVDETYRVTGIPAVEPLFERGRPYVHRLDDPDADGDESLDELLRTIGKSSCLGVPIVLDGRVWGELWATRGEGVPSYGVDDLPYAIAVASLVAAGLAQVEHLERIARLAYTDPLTGLANRRAVDDRLEEALARHREDGRVLSLVVCDVNGLKAINDRQGHEAGDRALVHFAGLLSASAGLVEGSLAGRTGGDEFCVILEGGTADHAVWVAEDLTRRAAASLDEGVACGVASTGDPVGPIDRPGRLFRLADAAQARAKRSRSRRPVVAGRDLSPDALTGSAPLGAAGPSRDRRRVRRPSRLDTPRILEEVLQTLDHAASPSTLERLELVADACGRLVDSCGWWVSHVAPGSSQLRTVGFSAYRRSDASTSEHQAFSAADAVFDLADYPQTAAVVSGGATAVATGRPGSDPGEQAILDAGGYVAVVMAGARDTEGGGWLVELYADAISGPYEGLAPVLRALVACAVQGAP